MKPSTRVLDRLIVGLVGLVLLAGGAWLLAYRAGVRPTITAAERLDPHAIASAPDQFWWRTEVGVVGLVLVIVAVWLLLQHLLGTPSKTAPAGDGGSVDLGQVGDAVAADLARHPLVSKARSTVVKEKGLPLIRVSISVPRDADSDELARIAHAAQREVAKATDPDVRLQILVNEVKEKARAVD